MTKSIYMDLNGQKMASECGLILPPPNEGVFFAQNPKSACVELKIALFEAQITFSAISEFVSRQNADFSATRQMRVFFSLKIRFPRPWQKKNAPKGVLKFKVQNLLFWTINQRGLAKIILPADVWSAEVTSTEIVRLK